MFSVESLMCAVPASRSTQRLELRMAERHPLSNRLTREDARRTETHSLEGVRRIVVTVYRLSAKLHDDLLDQGADMVCSRTALHVWSIWRVSNSPRFGYQACDLAAMAGKSIRSRRQHAVDRQFDVRSARSTVVGHRHYLYQDL